MAFIKDNSPPATIILISGDRDFAYLLSTIRWRKYNVVLICNPFMTHESLTAQASVVYDWQSDILKARPPPNPPLLRSRRNTSSSVAFLTAPQESDDSSEFDVHAVGFPNGHITPTIHLSHATLPPGAPILESKATPIPSKAEVPAEVASPSTPMTPTSDDRIVADLTIEPTTVHLSIVHVVVIDLQFEQDLSSPKMIDLVDEDDARSPAFVSACTKVPPTQLLIPESLELSGRDSIRG